MLQISQIEKPRCSARMDQKRLRLATNFPFDSQNCSSSGFQSVIQVDRGSLMGAPPFWLERNVGSCVPRLRPRREGPETDRAGFELGLLRDLVVGREGEVVRRLVEAPVAAPVEGKEAGAFADRLAHLRLRHRL